MKCMCIDANALAAEDPKEYLQLETPFYLNILLIALAHLLFQLLLWWSKARGEFDFFRVVESVFVSIPALVAYLLAIFEVREAYIPYFFLPFIHVFARYKFASIDKHIRAHFQQDYIQTEQQLIENENGNEGDNTSEKSEGDPYLQGVTKQRFEVFTDGVIAIAATLIVLDIQPMSDCKELKDPLSCAVHWDDGCRPGLSKKFSFECYFEVGESKEKNLYLMFSYAFCFAIVNVLWAQHHYIFDRIYSEGKGKITSFTLVLNLHFCIAVSMLPFACNLMTEYAIKPYKKEKDDPAGTLKSSYAEYLGTRLKLDESAGRTACLFTTTLLFLASVFLLGMLIEQKSGSTPPFVLLRYLSIPITTFVAIILLGTEVEGVLYWPLLAIPPIQLGWSAIELFIVRGKNAAVQQGSYVHLPGRRRNSNRRAPHLLDPNDYDQQNYGTQHQ
mmetsp:Transcript_32845/g.40355  ORF Transcript_32845/g.40355 Transcript_32845/m.40355 type:complete len:444 (+) Transcript_32845:102-1433(+)